MVIISKLKKVIRKLQFDCKYYFKQEKINLTYSEAETILFNYHPKPKSSAITHNHVEEILYDLTIIVPAFNAEKWIDECIQSIFSQKTEYSFVIKVIDDGSTDQTGKLIDQYGISEHICVIHQENRGYSGARNRGLEKLNSKYVMFVDSDDYLLPNAIQNLLAAAFKCDADIVEGNGYRFNESGKLGTIKDDSFTGIMGVPWMKVYRSELFERIQFPEGYLYEDKVIGSLVLEIAQKKLTINDLVYAYRIHSESITQKHDDNPQRLDSYWIMWLMQANQEELKIEADYENYIKAMRQIVMTYRRTIKLPEEIKKAIFVGSKEFLNRYYKDYVYTKDKCIKLSTAVMNGQYGKYKLFCENYMI